MKPGKKSESIQIKRALLKLSGEAFAGKKKLGLNKKSLSLIADQIKKARDKGVELAVVTGAGNILRGRDVTYLDRITSDHMGMLGTVINGLALKEALEKRGLRAKIFSALKIGFLEPGQLEEPINCVLEGEIVIFVGGTGNPYFTTDTASALRASQIDADIILKATNVDGVYSKDPQKNKKAELIKEITFRELIQKDLAVIDLPALDICKNNGIPIVVFNFFKESNLAKLLDGVPIGTLISN